jgi:parallel beta-helix repeat protein
MGAMRIPIRLAALALAALLAAASVSGGRASEAGARASRVVQVHPGELGPAIEAASGGDTLVVHAGTYRGSFVVDKRINILGARKERRPLIDGRCATRVTIAVTHAGVVLRHLQVVGADEGFGSFPSEVDFSGVASGGARGLLVRDTCDAEYGINVFGSRAVAVIGNRGRGFSDSTIYIGGITSTGDGALTVRGNEAFGNNRGIIVEDSAGGRVRLLGNRAHDNTISGEGAPAGIFLHNSDGVLLSGNVASDNGRFGIHLDANSDHNRLLDNTARGNPWGNFRDEGKGNCGAGNHPDSFPSCPRG